MIYKKQKYLLPKKKPLIAGKEAKSKIVKSKLTPKILFLEKEILI